MTRHMQLKLADTLSAGTIITLPVEFRDDDQALGFTRARAYHVGGPLLALSYAPDMPAVLSGRMVTWTLTARNNGALTAPVTVTLGVPFEQTWIDGSLQWNTGLLINRDDRLGWIGTLGIGRSVDGDLSHDDAVDAGAGVAVWQRHGCDRSRGVAGGKLCAGVALPGVSAGGEEIAVAQPSEALSLRRLVARRSAYTRHTSAPNKKICAE